MAKQNVGGCKKRKRARIAREHITERIKATRQRRHTSKGCAWPRQRTRSVWPKCAKMDEKDESYRKPTTFEEEYQTFRKTRGKRGLNPNPKFRQDENLVYLHRNSVFGGQKFQMVELMEQAIQYVEVS